MGPVVLFLEEMPTGVVAVLAGGTNHYRVLMDNFHHVSTAFLELGQG
jgi:hypothetical protein